MSQEPDTTVNKISDINARIKAIVENQTLGKPVAIGGLVQSVHQSDRGHVYFNLVDDPFSIRCFAHERLRGDLGFTIRSGMELEVYGEIKVYDRLARIELDAQQVRLIEQTSVSDFMSLEQQLEHKGLWPPTKKKLPAQINHIALVTSINSQAREDFKSAYRESGFGTAQISEEDVPLEGEFAPKKIAETIERINQQGQADVIVLTRGGGKRQALSVFDDLLIAEAISKSTIPVVCGVGHESDQTFADKVADLSAISPTAAAHIILKSQKPKKGCARYLAAVGLSGILLYLLMIMLVWV
jgi:exodeoxyribonuclease VII large subunit